MPWLSCRLKIAAFSSLPAFHRSNSDAIFLFLFFFPSSRNNCSRKHGWHVEQIFALALHCFCMTRPEAWQLGPVIVFDGLRTTSSRVCWGGRKNFFFFLKAEEDYFLLVWNRRGLTDRSAACLLLFFLFYETLNALLTGQTILYCHDVLLVITIALEQISILTTIHVGVVKKKILPIFEKSENHFNPKLQTRTESMLLKGIIL